MTLAQIAVLAAVQGLCELLPVSSSAHVIVAERLMGLDPTAPQMTLLLVMLHTGTMLAVIAYFRRSWRQRYFRSRTVFLRSTGLIALATALTGAVGLALLFLIERVILRASPHAEVEQLFGNLHLIAAGLAAAGTIILASSYRATHVRTRELGPRASAAVGIVQGLCLPFRGFSRSGATISTGLLFGIERAAAEDFSFALAVVLTPPVIAREAWRLVRDHSMKAATPDAMLGLLAPSAVGMVLSLVAGLLALHWLSRWLERGRWHWFGIYCLLASIVLFAASRWI